MKKENRFLNIKLLGICICFLFMYSQLVFADYKIESIRTLYYRINKLIKENKINEILFYTDGDGYIEGKWHKVKNIREKHLFEKSFFRAKVYLYGVNTVKFVMIIDSQVGDWTNSKEYYFYDNGKTAFVFEKHVTSQAHNVETGEDLPPGPYILERRRYFNEVGEEIKLLEKAFISDSNKEIAVKFIRQIDFGVEIYKDVSSLPMSKMLK